MHAANIMCTNLVRLNLFLHLTKYSDCCHPMQEFKIYSLSLQIIRTMSVGEAKLVEDIEEMRD